MSPKRLSINLAIFIAALFFLIFALSGWFAEFATNWLWFRSEGYAGVFWGTIFTRLGCGVSFGLASFLFLLANGLRVVRTTREGGAALPFDLRATPIGEFVRGPHVGRLVFAVCVLASLIAGLASSAWWDDVLLFIHGGKFNWSEPIFNRDAAFYVFTLPMLDHLLNLLRGLVVVSFLICLPLYILRGAFSVTMALVDNRIVPRGIKISSQARTHLAAHAASLMILMAFGQFLLRYDLMNQQQKLIAGPGFAEVYGEMPLRLVQSVITFCAALTVYWGIVRRKYRRTIGALVLAALAFAVATIYPRFLERFVVLPNQINREREFISHHIKATQFAFGLEKIEERSLSGDAKLDLDDIQANSGTLRNVRLWDHEPLLATFAQMQEIRSYYEFKTVDNDRYVINGELRQLMLSPRELQTRNLENPTWINQTMTYTHGYGIAMGPVNEVTAEGLPDLFVKDLPPKSSYPELNVSRPEIYFGEQTRLPVFVKTKSKEFDHPSGDENVFSSYEGDGGVSVGNFFSRLLFAIRFREIKLLLSSDFTSESRVLMNRNIRDRVREVAPFFNYDLDPYMVLEGGKLYWILDGYTSTWQFPYSVAIYDDRDLKGAPIIGNYMRNPVKVVLDAYNGRMTFYVSDRTDPIAAAWGRAFPSLLKPLDEMPAGLRAHLRHPEDFFKIQSELYATYHMTDPQMFYNREDQWEVPSVDSKVAPGRGKPQMSPYYTIMRLPGETKEEFIQMLPFAPKGKENLAAWMAVRSDGEHYGKLLVYRFPKGKLVFGPNNIIARINQDETISPQITLWNQHGSEVGFGTLLVIPIGESLIYVLPLYLRATQSSIPELKRVIVGYENEIAMGSTLDEALHHIFGASPGSEPPAAQKQPPPASVGSGPSASGTPASPGDREWIGRAKAHFDAAMEAQRTGDWARYGEEIKKLGEALEALNRDETKADGP
ncbi:UPF0182 family protein, partial [Candidatus Sumerlaeota bacterium]|nr:UPF0182 family protein [Candidatus Sumerlaeota bacterium]